MGSYGLILTLQDDCSTSAVGRIAIFGGALHAIACAISWAFVESLSVAILLDAVALPLCVVSVVAAELPAALSFQRLAEPALTLAMGAGLVVCIGAVSAIVSPAFASVESIAVAFLPLLASAVSALAPTGQPISSDAARDRGAFVRTVRQQRLSSCVIAALAAIQGMAAGLCGIEFEVGDGTYFLVSVCLCGFMGAGVIALSTVVRSGKANRGYSLLFAVLGGLLLSMICLAVVPGSYAPQQCSSLLSAAHLVSVAMFVASLSFLDADVSGRAPFFVVLLECAFRLLNELGLLVPKVAVTNAAITSVLIAICLGVIAIVFAASAIRHDEVSASDGAIKDEFDDSGESVLSPEAAADIEQGGEIPNLAQLQQRYGLTDRETEVMLLLSEGHSQKRIAELLVLSLSSVQTYSKRIYRKLDVHSKQEVIDLVASANGRDGAGSK